MWVVLTWSAQWIQRVAGITLSCCLAIKQTDQHWRKTRGRCLPPQARDRILWLNVLYIRQLYTDTLIARWQCPHAKRYKGSLNGLMSMEIYGVCSHHISAQLFDMWGCALHHIIKKPSEGISFVGMVFHCSHVQRHVESLRWNLVPCKNVQKVQKVFCSKMFLWRVSSNPLSLSGTLLSIGCYQARNKWTGAVNAQYLRSTYNKVKPEKPPMFRKTALDIGFLWFDMKKNYIKLFLLSVVREEPQSQMTYTVQLVVLFLTYCECSEPKGKLTKSSSDCSSSFLKFFLSVPSSPQKMKNRLEEQQKNTCICLAVSKLCCHGLEKTTTNKPCGEVCVAWRVQIWDDVCSLLASPAECWGGKWRRRVLVNGLWFKWTRGGRNSRGCEGLNWSKAGGRNIQGATVC